MHLHLDNLSFRYPASRIDRHQAAAVEHVDLQIADGEFFSLLGPSGCGKTTLLWMIAGFHIPAAGRILFDNKEVTRVPTERRNIGMVFQNYALFPHMTVAKNIAFGLATRGISKDTHGARIAEVLAQVGLHGVESRKPGELSGGQQQRVALARAIAPHPGLLLLDEPLSNLDAALRLSTRVNIHNLQRQLRLTTVYVTHDQQEALALSDRLAVMNQGRILQVGTPQTMYQEPDSSFVAGFLGQANFIPITPDDSTGTLAFAGQSLQSVSRAASLAENHPAMLFMRPEAARLVTDPSTDNANDSIRLQATVDSVEFLGARIHVHCTHPDTQNHVHRLDLPAEDQARIPASGKTIYFKYPINALRLLPETDK